MAQKQHPPPWPTQRFTVNCPRQEQDGLTSTSGFCAGALRNRRSCRDRMAERCHEISVTLSPKRIRLLSAWLRSGVFPAPRKPDKTVTGRREWLELVPWFVGIEVLVWFIQGCTASGLRDGGGCPAVHVAETVALFAGKNPYGRPNSKLRRIRCVTVDVLRIEGFP